MATPVSNSVALPAIDGGNGTIAGPVTVQSGGTLSPGASLGIPEEKVIHLWPGELGGQKVKFSILNDNSDTSTASKISQNEIVMPQCRAVARGG